MLRKLSHTEMCTHKEEIARECAFIIYIYNQTPYRVPTVKDDELVLENYYLLFFVSQIIWFRILHTIS